MTDNSRLTRRDTLAALASISAGVTMPAGRLLAQSAYPERRITVVLPYPGGGIVDILTRLVFDKVAETWKQTITVDPKPGANGNIAWDQVARAEPDGYTLTFFSPATIANSRMQAGLRWSEKSFVPVSATVWAPSAVAVHPSVPANTMAEFVDYAKKNPGKFNWANPGVGTSQHLNTAILMHATKMEMVEVAYKGQPPGIQDLMAGRVQLMLASIGLVAEHVKSGALKVLAVLGKTRSGLLPNAPTMTEAGFAEVNVVPWYGYCAPRGTPQPIVDALNGAIAGALKDGKVRASLEGQGLQPVDPMTSAELVALVASDTEKYAKVIQDANIRIGN